MIFSRSMGADYLTEMTNRAEGVAPLLADIPVEQGGGGAHMRPGEMLLSGWAACMNITTRKYLNRDNIAYDRVEVTVDLVRDEAGKSKFYSRIEIFSDVSDEVKSRIVEEVKSCPVCDILAGDAQFYGLEELDGSH